MESKQYKWTLKWSGLKPRESLFAAVEYLKTYNMWKPCEAHLATHEEYKALVEAGEIRKPESYWGIDEGEVGLIALSAYDQYSKTWEGINTAKEDFQAGFNEGEKKYRLLIDHEEAIEINKLLKKWRVEVDKPCTHYKSYYDRGWCSDCDYKGNCPRGSKDEIMNKLAKKLAEFGVDHNGNKRRN